MSAKIKSLPHSHKHKHKPKGVNKHAFERVYWPYIPFLAVAFIFLLAGTRSGLVSSLIKHPTKAVLSYATALSEQDLLNDTNHARLADSQKPLKINAELAKAAQSKANDMALRNYWSHNTPAGNPPWTFVSATGYNYQKLGENLAAGFVDSQATINGWMASPEHRENMLDTDYSEVGFGFANNPNYTSTGNSGPMTIVVAFYGEPQAVSLDKSNSVAVALAASDMSSQPPAAASRAQLALAGTSLSRYGSLISLLCLGALLAIWSGRHALSIRRTVFAGERYIINHPAIDFGVVMLALVFFAFTRSAGFAL